MNLLNIIKDYREFERSMQMVYKITKQYDQTAKIRELELSRLVVAAKKSNGYIEPKNKTMRVYENICTDIELEVNENTTGILINYVSGMPTIKVGTSFLEDDIMSERYIPSTQFIYNNFFNNSVFISIIGGAVDLIILQKKNKANKKSVKTGFIRDYNNFFNAITLKDYFRELQELRAVNFNLNKELKERDSSQYEITRKLEIDLLKRQLDSEKERSKGYQDVNAELRRKNANLTKANRWFYDGIKKLLK